MPSLTTPMLDVLRDDKNSGDCIFVPLCGKTKDMLWLSDNGFHVIGIKLNPIACDDLFSELSITLHISKHPKFVKYQHDHIELFCGNFFDLSSADLPVVHAVYDCKALIALPSDFGKSIS